MSTIIKTIIISLFCVSTVYAAVLSDTRSRNVVAEIDSITVEKNNDSVKEPPSKHIVSPDSLHVLQSDSTIIKTKDMFSDTSNLVFPKMFELGSLLKDTTDVWGSDYSAFGDIFEQMPGSYHFNPGVPGYVSHGSIFSGSRAQFNLVYDNLLLNDPITGMVDLNAIPTESVHQAALFSPKANQHSSAPFGESLYLSTRDIAKQPIRSRISYRTGAGYNDVDVRAGAQVNDKLKINAGSVVKTFSHYTNTNEYDGLKTNVNVQRKLFDKWHMTYTLLENRNSSLFPTSYYMLGDENFHNSWPMTAKDTRLDQGLTLTHLQNFTTTLQYTKLRREFYGQNHDGADLDHHTKTIRFYSKYSYPIKHAHVSIHGQYYNNDFTSNEWSSVSNSRLQFGAQFTSPPNERFYWNAGSIMLSQKLDDNQESWFLPNAGFAYNITNGLKWYGFAAQSVHHPNLEYMAAQLAFPEGSDRVTYPKTTKVGSGVETRFNSFNFFATSSIAYIENPVYAKASHDSLYYQNYPNHNIFSLDLGGTWQIFRDLSLNGKVRFSQMSVTAPANHPDMFAQGYIQYHHVFFKGDLDSHIRLGLTALGNRTATLPLYADYSDQSTTIGSAVVPYFHSFFVIRDAVVHFSVRNFLNLEYEYIAWQPMPGTQVLWGFTWNFWD